MNSVHGAVPRTCTVSGWSNGGSPTCTVSCGSLDDPINGRVTTTGTTLSNTATYTCNTGYTRSGGQTRTCQASGDWSGSEPVCNPVNCGSLTDPINGAVDTTSGTTFMMTATYTCNTGYTLVGAVTRTCQANTMWSLTAPTCTVICPNLGVPTNGGVTYSDTTIPRAMDSTATYSCVTGYDFSGTLSRTCATTGWSALIGGTPTCTVICPNLPVPTNGAPLVYSDTTIPRAEGSMVTYTCTAGFELIGTSMRTCSDSGWDGTAPTCRAICDILTVPDNGVISYSPDTTPRLDGAVATYSCDEGYRVSSGPDRDCGISGKWSGMSITCPIVECGVPLMVASSTRTFPPTTFGQTVTYSCQDNFVLSGNSTLTCMASGLWGTPPICSPICQDLPSPANGVISYDTMFSPRPAGTVATYTCDTGYDIFGPRTRTCQSDNTWSGGDTVCQASCPALTLSNGDITYTMDNPPIPVGRVATHICSDSFVLSGDATRTCTDSASGGMWSGSMLTCIGTCEDLPSITNGVITYSSTSPPRTDGSTATYSCGMGFLLRGDNNYENMSTRP
ncbi:CUB and sushi domain-containing protein 3-like isoform X1 [Halichondria panicea]|uniref:CUB and sushi domain-containing protein 3-like isoform X1 n=1 Tax=Halichondria panicea TaxID=6063 RepID=UPI00312BBA83